MHVEEFLLSAIEVLKKVKETQNLGKLDLVLDGMERMRRERGLDEKQVGVATAVKRMQHVIHEAEQKVENCCLIEDIDTLADWLIVKEVMKPVYADILELVEKSK